MALATMVHVGQRVALEPAALAHVRAAAARRLPTGELGETFHSAVSIKLSRIVNTKYKEKNLWH